MGVTKRIYEHDIRDILKMWSDQIKTIIPVLPQYYGEADIKILLKTYYPHEWHSVEIKYDYYNKKDQYLKKRFGKPRYCMKRADVLLKDVRLYKKICSAEYKANYSNSFSEKIYQKAVEALHAKRNPKIDRVNKKIETALNKTQQMTPAFLEQLIGLYERKNTTQKDRCYILQELKKYYNQRVIRFFFTLRVIEERLKQSNALLYVDSENASKSVWCIYELNYFLELDKPIYTIKKQDIDNDKFYITPLTDKWFVEPDYKKLPLIKVS